jgi:hypothetical protein
MTGRKLTQEETDLLMHITYTLPVGTRVKLIMETPDGKVHEAAIQADSCKIAVDATKKPPTASAQIEGAQGALVIAGEYSNLNDMLWAWTQKAN